MKSFLDARVKTTNYDYDNLGRLEKITYPDSTTELYDYDGVGYLSSCTDNEDQERTSPTMLWTVSSRPNIRPTYPLLSSSMNRSERDQAQRRPGPLRL